MTSFGATLEDYDTEIMVLMEHSTMHQISNWLRARQNGLVCLLFLDFVTKAIQYRRALARRVLMAPCVFGVHWLCLEDERI